MALPVVDAFGPRPALEAVGVEVVRHVVEEEVELGQEERTAQEEAGHGAERAEVEVGAREQPRSETEGHGKNERRHHHDAVVLGR